MPSCWVGVSWIPWSTNDFSLIRSGIFFCAKTWLTLFAQLCRHSVIFSFLSQSTNQIFLCFGNPLLVKSCLPFSSLMYCVFAFNPQLPSGLNGRFVNITCACGLSGWSRWIATSATMPWSTKFSWTYFVNNSFCSSSLSSTGKATLNSFAYREFARRSFFSTSFHNCSRLLAHSGAFFGVKIKLSGITARA